MGLTRSPPSTFIHHFGSLLVGLGVATNTSIPNLEMLVLSQIYDCSSRHPPLTRYPSPLCFDRKGNSAEKVKLPMSCSYDFKPADKSLDKLVNRD